MICIYYGEFYMRSVTYILLGIVALAQGSNLRSSLTPQKKLAPSAAAKLPIFEFLGQNTSAESDMTSLNGSKCTSAKPGVRECTDHGPLPTGLALGGKSTNGAENGEMHPVIAGQKLRWLTMEYFNDKLYYVYGNTGKYSFAPLLDAFSVKYGKAILTTEKWQAKSGAIFDNPTAKWHFDGGTLSLQQLGLDINTGQFQFISLDNSPPADKPKIDF